MIGILERCFHAYGEGSVDPFADAFARHLDRSHNLGDRLAGMITPQNLSPLHLPNRSRPRSTQALKMLHLLGRENEFETL